VKIITLHEPWASLIPLDFKRYETREWPTSYRGPLLIHAARKKMPKTFKLPLLYALGGCCAGDEYERLEAALDQIEQSPNYGCIIAIADLSLCLRMYSKHPFIGAHASNSIKIDSQSLVERLVGLWQPDRYALQLDNVRKLEPIPFKSRQGKLLDAPSEIIAQVRQQLGQAA